MKRASMANWEYAALVNEINAWYLVKPANMEPAQVEYSRDKDRKLITNFGMKWHRPTTWRTTKRRISSQYLKDSAGRNTGFQDLTYDQAIKKRSIKPKADDGSEPVIFYSSSDLLTTINLAGQEGWQLTGGIGLDNFQWRNRDSGGPIGETKWRMMRREL